MQRKRKLELFLEKERSTSLVRGTTENTQSFWAPKVISIHVPRERDDRADQNSTLSSRSFQSTSLVRGTTQYRCIIHIFVSISIHVPRERDDHEPDELPGGFFISIHVPRERDDADLRRRQTVRERFQSTSLVRGTTRAAPEHLRRTERGISIHVPRERDDPAPRHNRKAHQNFNPRPS